MARPGLFRRLWTALGSSSPSPGDRRGWFRGSDRVDEPEQVRRWDSAQTSRLNDTHWARATNQPINQDLVAYLDTLRARSLYECANSAFVAGMIETHTVDVVGPNGPTLQIQTENREFADRAESWWSDWWAQPEIGGQLSGADVLRLWVRCLWGYGEFLGQIVTDRGADTPVRARIQSLNPKRLATPMDRQAQKNLILGVQRTNAGKPTGYYIDQNPDDFRITPSPRFVRIPPRFVIHGFRTTEPGQARGIPWLAPVLQTIADVRDYDEQVLDAARQAADQGVLLHTDHPDARYIETNETTEVERRTIKTLPPGWSAFQMNPTQPSTQYREYRGEKLRELGRVVAMPLMMVELDSSDHNYSSARFDAQLYNRANAATQGWLAGRFLDRLVDLVIAESVAATGGKIPRPADARFVWTWPQPPHVDPTKEARAETDLLNNYTLTRSAAAAARGLDFETIVAQLQREAELMAAAGLETGTPAQTAAGSTADEPPDADDETDDADTASGADGPDDDDTDDDDRTARIDPVLARSLDLANRGTRNGGIRR